MPWWRRFYMLSVLIVSLFESSELGEDDLRELRQVDVTSKLIDELGKEFPSIKTVLIDERDVYLAEQIRSAPGERIVAVIGAGHRAGVARQLREPSQRDLADLDAIPPESPAWRWVGWGVPATILGLIGYIAWTKGVAAAGHNLAYWGMVTGVPSFLGAVAAMAHPLTALGALVAAPITTLTPVLGVGYVAALLQAYLRPPFVRELHAVGDDVASLSKWWSNRLLRILLVFILTSVGGSIGTFVGSAEIVSSLFG
jgi:pheromone shutdown-related protein TraB